MSADLILHEIPPSPNNIKIRVALGFKGLSFESRPLKMDGEFPYDRSGIARVSRQPLTPVLTHGKTVIFDSGAILRYLEANFPETAPLFSTDWNEMKEIERWEWIGRTAIPEPIGMIFQAAPKPDPDVGRQASAMIVERTAPIEERLSGHDFLVGDRLTAADVTLAPFVNYAMLPEGSPENPIVNCFHEHLKLGSGRDRTRAWARRVLEYAS